MNKALLFSSVICFVGIARADLMNGFVNNPTGNSTDFATSATSLGGTINSSINFNTHPTGALQANFYSGLGVTLAGTGDFTTVQFGAGPGQGNTFTTPLSNGEGAHPASNFVGGNTQGGTFTVSFATPVIGAGLFVIDLFNPTGANPVTLTAFTGSNGTGTNLGTFTAIGDNFQPNNLYFMGITDSSGPDIGSIRFTSPGAASDIVGLDNVVFATPPSGVPEPSSIVLLLTIGGIISMRARRHKAMRASE